MVIMFLLINVCFEVWQIKWHSIVDCLKLKLNKLVLIRMRLVYQFIYWSIHWKKYESPFAFHQDSLSTMKLLEQNLARSSSQPQLCNVLSIEAVADSFSSKNKRRGGDYYSTCFLSVIGVNKSKKLSYHWFRIYRKLLRYRPVRFSNNSGICGNNEVDRSCYEY